MAHSHFHMTHFFEFFLLKTEGEKIFCVRIHRYPILNASTNTDAYTNPRDGEKHMNCPNREVPQKPKLC